ncbi:hypothetical protein BBD66_06175 [Mammaliicoccus sciuri]|jgi:uncharacterized protein YqgQ|nr:hypothetical protein B5728_08015 [Mammaliicoccus sciuri]OOV37817.1 hypothetical protein BS756_13005 [Staphylococcus sp. MB371]KTT83494.1 hypothetical protein NS202_05395 [Mammaliicoccus sciuri]KTT86282.1 hypothetical protein NS1R_03540 [Mammaliicoccus sciuri]KTT88544.1 hypothetical protein NS112_08630 [Mammaliicoccus sciuri]
MRLGVNFMNNLYDVQQLLKKFGYIIYFKDEEDQLEMMEQEIKAMYQSMLIDKETFLQARLIINQRRIEKK